MKKRIVFEFLLFAVLTIFDMINTVLIIKFDNYILASLYMLLYYFISLVILVVLLVKNKRIFWSENLFCYLFSIIGLIFIINCDKFDSYLLIHIMNLVYVGIVMYASVKVKKMSTDRWQEHIGRFETTEKGWFRTVLGKTGDGSLSSDEKD